MSVGPSDSRSDEASRDEHSDRAHALLPADIFSSTVQLGAQRSFRGDSGERSESPALPPIPVRCPVGQGLPGAYEDHPGSRPVKVNEKIFVFLGSADSPTWPAITGKLEDSNAEALGVPGAEATGYGLGKRGWGDRPARHAEGAPLRRAQRLGPGELSPRGAEALRRRSTPPTDEFLGDRRSYSVQTGEEEARHEDRDQ
jgi:hypothetical protein